MPPTVALLVWLVLLLALIFLDPAKHSKTSAAIWIPIIWMFFIESRLPAQWLGGPVAGGGGGTTQGLEEGNSLDRTVYSALILLAIGVLVSRSFKWSEFFRGNRFLTAFILFTLASVVWSDFPFVAFKRWFRDVGNYLVILIVLTDPYPVEALRTFFRRLYYLLIPLSVLLVRYFPQMGKQYSVWTGAAEFVGVATSKNTLGVLCMIGGIFFFWDTVTRWPERKEKRIKKIIASNVALIAMALWLLTMSNSATSRVCLILACLIILAVNSKWGRRHSTFLKVALPASFLLYVTLAFGFGLNGLLASGVGRDPSLTGRTNIWQAVLSTNTNPLVGTGYDTFWLGPRLTHVWALAGPVNESHNGYLETYLNLGMIGLFLLIALLISSYTGIRRNTPELANLASLGSALWTIALFYNMTEAAFSAAFMCLTFLLVTVNIPEQQLENTLPQRVIQCKAAPLARSLPRYGRS